MLHPHLVPPIFFLKEVWSNSYKVDTCNRRYNGFPVHNNQSTFLFFYILENFTW